MLNIWKYKGINLERYKTFNMISNIVLVKQKKIKLWLLNFDDVITGLQTTFWKEFELIGYQYSIKNIKKKAFLEIDLGFSFNTLLKLHPAIYLRKKKRRYVLYSYEKNTLNLFVNFLNKLHIFPLFKVKGFIFQNPRKRLNYFSYNKPIAKRNEILEAFFLTTKFRTRFF
jgi:ribosomal protein L6P/L9E